MTFLGVNIWDKEEESRKFVAERGVSYPVGHDTGDRVAKIYGVQGTPTTVFVGRDGRVAAIVQGTMELESLTALLERLVQGP